jgi:NAD(P)-dependent dehydrogenase (short-subunit alcohol dehydrogenase family)
MNESRALQGRAALVTGAARGIGRAEALALAAAGAAVVVNDILTVDSPGAVDDVVATIRDSGGRAVGAVGSVANWDVAAGLVHTAAAEFGGLDIVVNNAGIVRHQLIEDISEADFDAIVSVNLKGTFAVCKHAIPLLRQSQHGRIINTCSNQWAAPISNAHYAASKGGVVSLTYDLANELLHDGITANAIAPFAATEMTRDVAERDAEDLARGTMSERRMRVKEERTPPEFVPPIVTYLASDAAADVTGCVFRAGGGKIGRYTHPVEASSIFRDELTGPWTFPELVDLLPRSLLRGYSRAPHLS